MQSLRKILDLTIAMVRPPVMVIILLFLLLPAALHNAIGVWPTTRLIIAALSLTAWYAAGTAINDIDDFEIDKINLKGAPTRPLANDKISLKNLKLFAAISMITALILAALLGVYPLLIFMIGLLLNWQYSRKPLHLSHRGIWAPLLLPLGYVAFPYLFGIFAYNLSFLHQDAIILAACYLSFIGRIILKDFRDVEGDTKFGKRTFLVRHGRHATVIVSAVFWTLGLSLLPFAITSLPVLSLEALSGIGILGCLLLLGKTSKMGPQQHIISAIARLGTAVVITPILYWYASAQNFSTLKTAGLVLGVWSFLAIIAIQQLRERDVTPIAAHY